MEQLQAPEETIAKRYRILAPLAQGGNGITYLGEDLDTGERVVLKALSLRQIHDWKAIERFEREAQVLAQLNHPGIPHYLDYFHLDTPRDRSFYIIQQFAPGCSLAESVQNGWRGNEREIRQIAIQVLDILVYLQQQTPPIIHRDIKPNHIIRSNDGRIVLIDFGAVQTTYYSTLARSHTVVGTFGYMAPEQFLGQAVPATDLYGLGATLLFLLTHRSPADLPINHLTTDSRCFRIQISAAFADWLETILEPDLKHRFACAETALAELQNQRVSVKLKPVPSKSPFWKPLVFGGILASIILGINTFKYPILSTIRLTPPQVYEAAEQGDITTIQQYLKNGLGVNARNGDYTTPLHWVGSAEMAQLLITAGADVNATDQYGWTPLHYARSRDIAALLIAHGANIHAQSQPNWEQLHGYHWNWGKLLPGITPLHVARSAEIAQLLIDQGADVNAKDAKTNRTPLHLANSPEIAAVLIKNGAKIEADQINTAYHPHGTLLHQASQIESKLMIEFLLQSGANIVAKDYQDNTPLHFAPSPEIAALLIADINARNSYGETPLHKAVENDKTELVEFLLAKGGNSNAQDNQGETPLHKADNNTIIELLLDQNANSNAQDNWGNTPLHNAASLLKLDRVALLIAKGANVNARNNQGNTPLHIAITNQTRDDFKGNNDLDVIKLLIANGAYVNMPNNQFYSPLHIAAWNNLDAVKLLIEKGAEINLPNREGKTPLHCTGLQDIALFLVNSGADINAIDLNGDTPLHKAVRNNWSKLVVQLLARGAEVNVMNFDGETPLQLAQEDYIKKLLEDYDALP
ncbi:MAG: ankyrin repeat domain-containing protein [Coleofasciculus sp.]